MVLIKQPKKEGHYYYPDGTPCFEVPNASNGGMRPTTVADARKLGLFPSVTTLISVLNKFQLNEWVERVAIEVCWKFPKGISESKDEYLERLMGEVEKVRSEAPDLGTDIHRALQSYHETGRVDPLYAEYIAGVAGYYANTGITVIKSESRIKADLVGYGGTIDVIAEDSTKTPIILDYKSTKTRGRKVTPYASYLMQIAAYKYAKTVEDSAFKNARCIILYVSTDEANKVIEYEASEEGQAYHLEMFKTCEKLWKLEKHFTTKGE